VAGTLSGAPVIPMPVHDESLSYSLLKSAFKYQQFCSLTHRYKRKEPCISTENQITIRWTAGNVLARSIRVAREGKTTCRSLPSLDNYGASDSNSRSRLKLSKLICLYFGVHSRYKACPLAGRPIVGITHFNCIWTTLTVM
jgi:hypothetical protein